MKKILKKTMRTNGAALAVSLQLVSLTLISLIVGLGGDTDRVASISTDKHDYTSGEVVTIIASGFAPNGTVALHIDASDGSVVWDNFATPDASGNVSNSQFIVQNKDVGMVFTLTATGLSSGQKATTTFDSFEPTGPLPAPPASPTPTSPPFIPGIAPTGDPGGFVISGEIEAVLNFTDWTQGPMGEGTGLLPREPGCPAPNPSPGITSRRCAGGCTPAPDNRCEPYGSGNIDDIFTSSKLEDDPNTYLDDPNHAGWQWKYGSANNKTDMNNVMVHVNTDSRGHKWLVASGDRLSNNGTSYIDFELYQATLVKTPIGTVGQNGGFQTTPDNRATGGRAVGDHLITVQYGNGGTDAQVFIFRWGLSGGKYQYNPIDPNMITCGSSGSAFYVANNVITVNVPYKAFDGNTSASNAPPLSPDWTQYAQNQFAEVAVDMSCVLASEGDVCRIAQFSTVFVKTKTSTAPTATLEDLAEPFQIPITIGLTVLGTKQDPACPSDSGTVCAEFSGGIGPYMCKLDDGTFAPCTSPQCYPVPAGSSHVITVKDSLDPPCTKDTGTLTVGTGDTTAPTIGSPGPNDTVEGCPTTFTPSFTAPTASDNRDGTITPMPLGDTTSGNTLCNKTITRSWRAVDACGNTSGTVSQSITVKDTTAPVIGMPGMSTTIEGCPVTFVPSFTAPTASDNCDGPVTPIALGDTTSGNTLCNKTITRSWRAVDACTNTSGTVSQSITVRDTTPPSIGSAGGNTTVSGCPATTTFGSLSFTPPTASDTCNGATVNIVSDVTTGNNCSKVFTRTWDATDACNNHSVTRSQSITVNDTTAPSIGAAGGNTTISGCPATTTFGSLSFTPPTASDTCNGATVNIVSDVTTGNNCSKVFTRTWDATDACNNHSVTRSQSITVNDTTAPSIGAAGGNTTISGCPATTTFGSLSFTPPTASDTCNGATVNIVSDVTTGNNCSKVFTRTWDATDACNNHSVTRSQSITVNDTTAPSIGPAGNDGAISGCPATTTFGSLSFTPPTASDTCNGATVNIVSDVTTGNNCSKVFTRTWDATDACNNHSVTRSQSITVNDTTAPSIGPAGNDGAISGCPATTTFGSLSFTPPTASDTCNGATVNIVSDVTTGNNCSKVFTRTWDATDACNNHSVTRSQSITVNDTTAPSIGPAGNDGAISGCPATTTFGSLSFTPPTASDTCNGATVNIVSDVTTGNNCSKVFTRTWDATDACGNHSVTRSQSITVNDTTAPSIGAAGGDTTISGCPATTTFGSLSFTPPTASDTCNGATVNIVSDVTTGNNCSKIFTRTWDATDACNNHSLTRSQSITVNDTTAPSIGAPGANVAVEGCPATTTFGSLSFTPPTASDTCNGATVNIVSDVTTGNNCSKIFTRTWDATDACNNHSLTRSQSITVNDTTAPSIGAPGANVTVEGCPATFVPSFTAPTASDNCPGTLTPIPVGCTTSGNTLCNKTMTCSWRAMDACGNTSGTVSQSITVRDTTAPSIGAAGGDTTISGCPATTTFGSLSFTPPTASDTCNGATVNIVSDVTTGNNCSKIFTRTWDATDACGNHSLLQRSQSITVNDTTAPIIGSPGPDDTIECPATPSFTRPTASDVCGGSTVQQVSDTTVPGSGGIDYTRTVCWNAVDACGNSSGTVCQTITVRCPCPQPCEPRGSIQSNFNGTSISPSNYIWFNANFNASNVTNGTTICFMNSTIHIVSSTGTAYDVMIPNATITFSASATCASTTFTGGQWVTTVPLSGSDEIFLSGLLIKSSTITGSTTVDLKSSTVTWMGDFSSNTTGVTLKWKWAAAVYQPKNNNDTLLADAVNNPNLIGVKPIHNATACGYTGSDHAGTPMNLKNRVVGGARGGGGSNFTGSWSGTQTPCVLLCPACGASGDSTFKVKHASTASSTRTESPATNLCPPTPGTRLRTLTMTYEGRNSGGGTVTGNPNGLDTAYIVATGGSSDLFVGLMTFNSRKDPYSAYFVIDAGTAETLPDQVTVEIHKGQTRLSPIVSTVTFDTSCNQPINEGDYFGSLRVSDGSQ